MKLIKYVIFLTLLTNSLSVYSMAVGIAKFAPPFSSVDTNNHYFGFCIDLINEICKRMNEKCEYKAIIPGNIIEELNKGTIDITLTQNPIPPNLSPNYIYSLPYMTSNGQFVTSNPNIKSLDDLKNKRIGILEQSHLDNVLLLYTSKDNIKQYAKLPQVITALMDDEIDAILFNVNIFKYLSNNKIINFLPVGNPINIGNGYGILALKKNTNLINKVNTALLNMENDGTYEKIYNKYFGH